MPRGSRPGENRGGGRKKGSKNKATIEKELIAQMLLSSLTLTGHASRLAKDVLADCMGRMLELAEKYRKDEEKFIRFTTLAQSFACDLAPFQSPRLQTLKVGGDRDNPLQIQEGETAETIRLELEQMMRETGLVPTKLIEGVANKTNGGGGNGHDA